MSLLVFGYGNPSRGDDALGPEFVRAVEQRFASAVASGALVVLSDFQLQVEHALDLRGCSSVLFVDACATPLDSGFVFTPLVGQKPNGALTHALPPQAVLSTYELVERRAPPPAWLLAIEGVQFELGAEMSAHARGALERALVAFEQRFGPFACCASSPMQN